MSIYPRISDRESREDFSRLMSSTPDPRRGGPPYDPHAESLASILARHRWEPTTHIDTPGGGVEVVWVEALGLEVRAVGRKSNG